MELATSLEVCKTSVQTHEIQTNEKQQNSVALQAVNTITSQNQQTSSSSSKIDEDKIVLHVEGEGSPPILIKGKINGHEFNAIIDSGSPVSIFTASDLKKILKQTTVFARPLPSTEKYVDFNRRPLRLLGY